MCINAPVYLQLIKHFIATACPETMVTRGDLSSTILIGQSSSMLNVMTRPSRLRCD